MKNLRVSKFRERRLRLNFTAKLVIFTLILVFLLNIIVNIKKYSFYADIINFSTNLIEKEVLIAKLDDMKDSSANWPLRQVTNWWGVTNYEQTKWTDWNLLASDLKTPFPQWDISSILSKYQRVNLYNMYDHISNQWEREVLSFYRRLFGATWTAKYCVSKDDCLSWVPDSWTHAWIDLISSIWTPVYASMNWVVMKACQWDSCDAFWNQIVIATNFDWQVLATFYWHLKSLESTFVQWDLIQKWQLLWYIWNSWNSTVPHLHFQINKLWSVSEIKNLNIAEKLYDGWYHNLEWVRKNTIDPISFVTWNKITKSDSLVVNTDVDDNSDDLLASIQSQIETTTPKETLAFAAAWKEPFRVVDTKVNKINSKLTVWDTIKLTINTTWEQWSISISTNNNVLKTSTNTISPAGINSYDIMITANSIWNWQVDINDGKNVKQVYFSVYDTDMNVYWLEVKWDNIVYTSYENEFVVYPIDKLWNRIFTNLEWTFTFELYNKETSSSQKINQFTNSEKDATISFKLKAPQIWSYKLKVYYEDAKKSLMATKNLDTDLFFDYSINNKFWNSINYLLKNWIVKWHAWLLMPNNTITRAEIITTIVRQKYWDDFDSFEKQMKSEISANGRFLKDIKGDEWYAPYIYIWWKNSIVKGTNWYSNAEKNISKAELLALLWRTYNVEISDPYISWDDVLYDDWFKPYADAAKKYNLFPFEDTKVFWADVQVTRIQSFEALYRYITTNPEILSFTSTALTNNEQVEILVKSIIKF